MALLPIAVLALPMVFAGSTTKPTAVFANPIVLARRVPLPTAVLASPVVLANAPVPPAVFPPASLTVGLQPGELQVGGRGGGPALDVSFSIRVSSIIIAKRRTSRFMGGPLCAGRTGEE